MNWPYIVAGLLVGLMVGMTGVGGGSLMTPLLILFFGVSPASAVGTDLLFAASTKMIGTIAHGAGRTIQWRVVGLLALGSVPASLLSLLILASVDFRSEQAGHIITLALGIVLLLTALFLFCTRPIRLHYEGYLNALGELRITRLTVALGVVMGVFVTFTSVGAGAIGVTALILLYPKMPISRIVGSDIAHAVPLTLLAGAGHWFIGSLNTVLLLPLLVGSFPGIILGTYAARWAPESVLRFALAIVLCIAGYQLVM
jgi:hypothetical protein